MYSLSQRFLTAFLHAQHSGDDGNKPLPSSLCTVIRCPHSATQVTLSGNGATLNGIRVRLLLFTCAHSFRSHPNLGDEVNRNIVQSEIEGDVFLNDLPPATVLEIQTQHRCYRVVLLSDNNALNSGRHQDCPQPISVAIAGSTWGGSMLKRRFVGRGMHLEFCHLDYQDTDCHVTYSGNPRATDGVDPRSMRWHRLPGYNVRGVPSRNG